ncbi:phosphate--AMP phosphotransferase [Methanolapillus millepedarum]|uniref:Polyphosphate:AMP phosphotransferase n=1 Tax=Methanolapillus millepedarum TaxID=3028296 RepID=A0AA96V1S2_9EURY|nr:Polyphosphate:AMP phosphotransferase [Methanosarcinaceae archaeon Ac7]
MNEVTLKDVKTVVLSKVSIDIPNNKTYKDLIEEYGNELGILQREVRRLNLSVTIVFEGWYDSFIGEIINQQLLPLDSRGFDFYFTEAPTSEERKKPFMTRFSQKIAPMGKIAVFDRSWYMRGLIEHLMDDSNPLMCGQNPALENNSALSLFTETTKKEIIHTERFEKLVNNINGFEKTLTDDGSILIKIYFGISKEDRLKRKSTWKKTIPYIIDKRSTEKVYREDIYVIKELLDRTHTESSPWKLIFVKQDLDFAILQTMKTIIDQLKPAVEHAQLKLETEYKSDTDVTVIEKINDLVRPAGETISVSGYADHLGKTDLTKSYTKKEYQKKLKEYQNRLSFLHYVLYSQKKSMVLVFEGWDAAGKGGSIKRIVQSMNPRFYRVIPIASPTDVDLRHHYLWRFLDGIPTCGKTSIYDRSWYGRVMVERVEHFCTEEEWQRAYSEINLFERMLTDSGMIVIKFWLHVSKEKQLERFNARAANPLKQWKLTEEDWRNREKWDEYYDAVNQMIEETDTQDAPWVIVESDDKYYARIKILKNIIKHIEKAIPGPEKVDKKKLFE